MVFAEAGLGDGCLAFGCFLREGELRVDRLDVALLAFEQPLVSHPPVADLSSVTEQASVVLNGAMASLVSGPRLATALRVWAHRRSTRFYGPSRSITALSWIGSERIAVGCLPTGESLPILSGQGVTHVVNCRARLQTWVSQDLSVERAIFGAGKVVHASMWDTGQFQPPALWATAAMFAATTLENDPQAGVLIHCQQGRRRSVMLAYAVLRLRGHASEEATGLILAHRREAVLVPNYRASVEQWLSATGQGRPRG